MSNGVEFDEDKISYGGHPRYANMTSPAGGGYSPMSSSPQSGMVGWLVRKGWAKTVAAAQGILVALIVINIVITYIVIAYFL